MIQNIRSTDDREKLITLRVEHILDNLCEEARGNPHFLEPKKERLEGIRKALDLGIKPHNFEPIELATHTMTGKYFVCDGYHRLHVFKERGIEHIRAIVDTDEGEESSSRFL